MFNFCVLFLQIGKTNQACSQWLQFRKYPLDEKPSFYDQHVIKLQQQESLKDNHNNKGGNDTVPELSDSQVLTLDRIVLALWRVEVANARIKTALQQNKQQPFNPEDMIDISTE